MKTLADLTAPATANRVLLEKDVQGACVDWARKRGYWARKFSSISQRSVPDYLFAKESMQKIDRYVAVDEYPLRIKFACEFKAPGKTSTDKQKDEQAIMRGAGWFVFECNDFEVFKQTVQDYERACTV